MKYLNYLCTIIKNRNIMKRELTQEEIDILISNGFGQDDDEHSGFYYKDYDDGMFGNYSVLSPEDEGIYLIDTFQGDFEEECGFFEHHNSNYSKVGQSLEDFLKDY